MLGLATKTLLNGIGSQIVADLQKSIRTKNAVGYGAVNASGRLANSVRFEVSDKGLFVYAANYIYQAEYGRAPTVNGGNGEVRMRIRRWIDDKGITPTRGTKDSLAYAIARKIHKEGTLAYKQYKATGKGTGVVTSVINVELNNRTQAELEKLILDNLLLSIKNTWD
jgi:hypothetical protein